MQWWLKAYTNGNAGDKFTIAAGGNVGIGTSSVGTYKLNVAGAIRIGVSGTIQPLLSRDSSTGGLIVSSVGNSGDFIFQGTSGSEKFRIKDTGNVGIGTTSPDSILHVNGYRLRLGDGASDSKLWGTPASGGNFLIGQSSSTGKIKFVSSTDSSLVTILNGGNVGIGTTSPTQKLHVVGNARVTGAYYDSNNSPGTSGQVLSSTATGTDWVSAGGTSGFAPMVKFNRSGINSSTYTMIATVNGNNLSSVLKMTMTGTSNNVVFACAFDITVNHSQDIHVKSSNGDYMEVTLRITSDGNEDFSIEAKHNGSTTTQAEVCIFPLADEIITPTTTDPGYTGVEYEHTATEGWRYGGVDNNVESSNVVIDGKLGIGTTSLSEKLAVQTSFTTSASDSYIEINSGHEASGGSDFTGKAGVLFKQAGSGNVLRNAGSIVSGREGNYSATSLADSYLAFSTAINNVNTERMRIDSAGKVSVGSPISGQLGVRGTTNDSTAYSFEAANSHQVILY